MFHDPVQQLCGVSQHGKGQPQHVEGEVFSLFGAKILKQILQLEAGLDLKELSCL